MRHVEALVALTTDSGAALLREIEACVEPRPADVARWRRVCAADVVAAAMDVAAGRRSLRGRRGDWATFWADREGAAQASDDRSAAWKADRLAGDAPLVDLCCGCGADLVALRPVVPSARGVDLRGDRAWMAARNAGAVAQTADVTTHDFHERAVHIDPARRDESSGKRRHAWHDLNPGPEFIARLAGQTHALAMKLGPGVEIPPTSVPAIRNWRSSLATAH